MYDLIYGDYKDEETVKKQYPNIEIEDARDEIHRERFGITFKDEEFDEHEYLKFLLTSGLFQISLHFNLISMDKEALPKLNKAIKELKKEQPEIFKS